MPPACLSPRKSLPRLRAPRLPSAPPRLLDLRSPPETFAQAEKLVQVAMTSADRATAAGNWRMQMAPLYERRTGPRKVALEESLAPATQWNPVLAGHAASAVANGFVRSPDPHTPLPAKEDDIAFAPVAQLSRWIESRQLTSERLTRIYLDRLQRFDPTATLCHHPDPRPCPWTSPTGRQGNRRRPLSRSIARHSLGRQRPARHGGHPYNVWR